MPPLCFWKKPLSEFIYSPPLHTGLDIVYQDDALLVLNKPSGLLSVPGRGEQYADCLVSRVHTEYPQALLVHRLDMSTSGILVMALTPQAQRALGKSFELRATEKRYIAVVDGLLEGEGEVNLPLLVDWPNRPKHAVNFTDGKSALTRYKAQQYDAAHDTTRVELTPITGRTHQLRVHMQEIGHTIVGDDLYASPAVRAKADRLLLHAAFLSIPHPISGETLALHCAPSF